MAVRVAINGFGRIGRNTLRAALGHSQYGKKFEIGKGVGKAKEVIRKHVEFLDVDRPLYDDHNKMMALVKSCEILEEVEKVVGNLG